MTLNKQINKGTFWAIHIASTSTITFHNFVWIVHVSRIEFIADFNTFSVGVRCRLSIIDINNLIIFNSVIPSFTYPFDFECIIFICRLIKFEKKEKQKIREEQKSKYKYVRAEYLHISQLSAVERVKLLLVSAWRCSLSHLAFCAGLDAIVSA